MKTVVRLVQPSLFALMVLAGFLSVARAQNVSIPDAGLDAAIRAALNRPTGTLTDSDLLTLTNLDASRRNIHNIGGLGSASNLVSVDLQINLLASISIPPGLTKLAIVNLSSNPLTNCILPAELTNLASLIIDGGGLSNLAFPAGLVQLTNLDLANNQFAVFTLPANLPSLASLDLGFNLLSNFTLPASLPNLRTFTIRGNPMTSITLPAGFARMTNLDVSETFLTNFTLPAGMSNLVQLNLGFNQLTNVNLPNDLTNLFTLLLNVNQFSKLNLPSNLPKLNFLNLRGNKFTNFVFTTNLAALAHFDLSKNPLTNIVMPANLTNLAILRLSENQLANLILPVGLSHLTALILSENLLTNLTLPPDLSQLRMLNLGGNLLASFTPPLGLTNLVDLILTGNLLTSITIPPDETQLNTLGFLGNPLTEIILPETIAALALSDEVDFLQTQGVVIFTYPLTLQLVAPGRTDTGQFGFALTGPPGIYSILSSTDLVAWSAEGTVINTHGVGRFDDPATPLLPQKFFRAALQNPPSNMVFIPANTFIMGSPVAELHRQPNEGPQTTVTLSHGFWMGKYEVTQGEYLAVTGTNPSFFPGDLSRPVSSVSWPDATNYCWLLTQQERAAGRISADSQYRLPTESEWECAARAGTTTRFSYGDDTNYESLTNYAWYFQNGGFTVQPVGQKLPNPWGLYDMTGNVWEWCSDWLGPLPGGSVTDPQGPPSNPIGVKVIRGGGYDFGDSDCRSARRFSFGNHPALTDTDLGFRVVLVTATQ
jgi:formylglycine-generating enzyme required for sulfatase activity